MSINYGGANILCGQQILLTHHDSKYESIQI